MTRLLVPFSSLKYFLYRKVLNTPLVYLIFFSHLCFMNIVFFFNNKNYLKCSPSEAELHYLERVHSNSSVENYSIYIWVKIIFHVYTVDVKHPSTSSCVYLLKFWISLMEIVALPLFYISIQHIVWCLCESIFLLVHFKKRLTFF